MFQTLYKPFEAIPVVKDTHSDVVPDMAFTPREIISKFSRGEKVPLGFEPMYDSEDDADSLDANTPDIWEDDPTRDPNFDFGDFVEEKHALQERQAQQRAQRKSASNAKASDGSKRKASAEELSASDAMKRETTSEEPSKRPAE